MAGDEWDIYVVTEVREWIEQLDDATHARVVQAIDALAEGGPGLAWMTQGMAVPPEGFRLMEVSA
ncbi:type II toxin-antitoxin system RelE/ParE family toxin [Planomonospora venezuelensis]|uniref:Uncharacterized protein n=1 Tax=Planomonospora venezuelensis TaxID=1999 RepID=A0A841DBA8_PLAVE|nr:type II toxin-antitoxin system RelE/ParE family toxin [Planomonospora venezuelensis]MBB5967421.1 hypothetical protein [Planomonospora venezuelensis]